MTPPRGARLSIPERGAEKRLKKEEWEKRKDEEGGWLCLGYSSPPSPGADISPVCMEAEATES